MRRASTPRAPHGPKARPRPLLAQPGPFSILCSSQAEAAGQKPPAGFSVRLSDGAPTQGTHTRWAWLGAPSGPGPRDPSCVHNMIPRDGSGGVPIRGRAESALAPPLPCTPCPRWSHDSTEGTEQNGGWLSTGSYTSPTRPQEGPGSDASGSTVRLMVRGSGGTVRFIWFLENAVNT